MQLMPGDNWVVERNFVARASSCGISLWRGSGDSARNMVVRYNWIDNIGNAPESGFNTEISISGANEAGYGDGWAGLVIAYNVVRHCTGNVANAESIGIRVKPGDPTNDADRIRVIGNVIAQCNYSLYVRPSSESRLGYIFQNNISYAPNPGGYHAYIEGATIKDAVMTYNCWYPDTSGGNNRFSWCWKANSSFADFAMAAATGGAVVAPGSLTLDPRFVDATGGSFTLQTGSPCIDTGVRLGDTANALAPTSLWPDQITTLDQNGCGSGWEMGAYGYLPTGGGAYTLTLSATNGTVTKTPNQTSYTAGQTVTLQATPSMGYTFSGWSGSLTGTANPATLVVDANKSVTANFTATPVTYTLTLSATNGTVTKTPNHTSYTAGQTVTLQATPSTGYTFNGWSGSLTGTANPATLVMDANKSVSANFAANTYTLAVSATNGSVSRIPDKTSYAYGEVVTLQATAATGYSFTGWSGDAAGTSPTVSVTMNSNKTVVANFTANTYTLTVNATNGSVSRTPDKTSYTYGEVVTLQATPATGYNFTGWSGDAAGTNPTVSVTMNSNKTVVANFTNKSDDQEPPVLAGCSPAPDSIQVPPNMLIALHLSDGAQGVDPASVSIRVNGNLIYAGDANSYSTTYGVCHRSGTKEDYLYLYQQWESFGYGAIIPVVVSARDFAGNTLSEQTYSFTTEMHSFGLNRIVTPDRTGMTRGKPASVSDSSGNIWIVWEAGSVGQRHVYLSRFSQDTDTYVKKQLDRTTGDHCNAVIAAAPSGVLCVAWQENTRGVWEICTSVSTDGNTWLTPQRIVDSKSNQLNPTIAVGRQLNGLIVIAWQDDRAGNQDIYVARSTDRFLTSAVARVTSDGSDQIDPAIAVDGTDTIYVLWTDARNGSTDIYGAASDNGPWANVPVVNSASGQSHPVATAGSKAATLYLAWVDDAMGDPDIYYAASEGLPTGGLTGTSIIDDTSHANQQKPAIAVAVRPNGTDRVFVCWQDERNLAYSGDKDVYFADLSPGSVPTNVLVDDEGSGRIQNDATLAVDRCHYPYVVWAQNAEIHYAGATYANPVPVATGQASTAADVIVGTPRARISTLDDVSVAIPAQACPFDLRIRISGIRNPEGIVSPSWRFYEFGPSGLTFAQPVTIVIPYDRGSGKFKLYWFDTTLGVFGDSVSDVEDVVINSRIAVLRFKTTRFRSFCLLAAETLPQ
jgi:uncharacterized repeat protein (TIGR02543 family)